MGASKPCPSCQSIGRDSTGNHLFLMKDDVTHYCGKCGYMERDGAILNHGHLTNVTEGSPDSIKSNKLSIEDVKQLPHLPVRGITADVMKKYGVHTSVSEDTGEVDKVYFPVYRNGKVIGYKARGDSKKFWSVGDISGAVQLFGQNLYGDGGKFLIITEGEFDAMSASVMLSAAGKDYKVVSLPNGASARDFSANLEWLSGFDKVVLCFDQDEPGRKATEACAALLPPNKAYITSMPEKDANDMLNKALYKQFLDCVYNAKEFKMDDILSFSDVFQSLVNSKPIKSLPYPDSWVKMNEMTRGIRLGEIDTWIAGTGVGKSSIIREIMYHLISHADTSGNIATIHVEEPMEMVAADLIGLRLGRRLRFPEVRRDVSMEDQLKVAEEFSKRMFFVKEEFLTDLEKFKLKIRYMHHNLGCNYILIDHIHGLLPLLYKSSTDDNSSIDSLISTINSLKKELNVWFGLVAHTRKTGASQLSFESGGAPSPDDIKGSGAIKQYSHGIYALSRNKLSDDSIIKNTTLLTVHKSRYTGLSGNADRLYYNPVTGTLSVLEEDAPVGS